MTYFSRSSSKTSLLLVTALLLVFIALPIATVLYARHKVSAHMGPDYNVSFRSVEFNSFGCWVSLCFTVSITTPTYRNTFPVYWTLQPLGRINYQLG